MEQLMRVKNYKRVIGYIRQWLLVTRNTRIMVKDYDCKPIKIIKHVK